jgi:hypothetical protein
MPDRRHPHFIAALLFAGAASVASLAPMDPLAAQPARPAATTKAAPAGGAAARCDRLTGLQREVCERCEGQGRSDASLFFCRESAKTAYCVKRAFKGDLECQPQDRPPAYSP